MFRFCINGKKISFSHTSFYLGKEELRGHVSTCVCLGIINMDWWSLPPPLSQPKKIGDDFCGLVLNQPLGGLRVIEGNPLYEDRTEGMGAVAAYTYGEHTVVFVGTRSGQLKKVRDNGLALGWSSGYYWVMEELFYVTGKWKNCVGVMGEKAWLYCTFEMFISLLVVPSSTLVKFYF